MEGGSSKRRGFGARRTPLGPGWAALAVAGAWAILPPYAGPLLGWELDVAGSVEVVDHVVPGAVVIAAALGSLLFPETGALRGMALAGLSLLAGLWTTASHVPLLLDAGSPAAPWEAALLHASAGPPVMALAAWLLAREAGT